MKRIVAIGHTFDLEIERRLVEGTGCELIDGRMPYDPAAIEGILLGTAAKVDAGLISAMPRLRGIMRYGIGFDNVDVGAARQAGVTVGIVRDYCVEEVAEHALTSALALLRALVHWDSNVRAGQWRAGPRPRHRRISNLTFGVMGYGLIGRAIARKASGLFGAVIIHDPWLKTVDGSVDGYGVENTLETFLGRVDAVSLHLPLSTDTRHLFDAATLALMKPDAVLVNASRGGLIDEAALVAALDAGAIGGAALDTFETEPLPAGHPFMDQERVILSPHVAWLSEEAEIALRSSATLDLLKILDGAAPSCPVN